MGSGRVGLKNKEGGGRGRENGESDRKGGRGRGQEVNK